jgi:hypothetical protein
VHEDGKTPGESGGTGGPARAAEWSCTGCGKSLRGYAKAKTRCGYCQREPSWCIGCGEVDSRGQRGLRCEPCKDVWAAGESERVRQWQADNPEATKLIRARSRSKVRDIEFSITVEDILAAWPGDSRCPVFRVELVRNFGQAHASASSPSLDRTDNGRGYVAGNIWIISVEANGKKRDYSIGELADGLAGPEWQAWAVSSLQPELDITRPRPLRRGRG